MKTLVELIVELDRVFDEKAKDGSEPVYLFVDGQFVPLDEVVCEYSAVHAKKIVTLKGRIQ